MLFNFLIYCHPSSKGVITLSCLNYWQQGQAVGSIASMNTRNGLDSPSSQQDGDDSQAAKTTIPDFPEDIWCRIHFLMPLHDAARAACLSWAFLRSWRCRPSLASTREVFPSEEHSHVVNVSDIIDRILRNRSGTGVKILKLQLDGIALLCLDRWLKLAVTPTTEELIVMLCTSFTAECNFPCSVLSNGIRSSILYFELGSCAFRPTAELGTLRNLTSLSLHFVHVTEDELECFLSNSSIALEQLNLRNCEEIICLKIP